MTEESANKEAPAALLPIPVNRKTATDGLAAFDEFLDGVKALYHKAEELGVPLVAYAGYQIQDDEHKSDRLYLKVGAPVSIEYAEEHIRKNCE